MLQTPIIPGLHGWTALHRYAAPSGHDRAVQLLMNAVVNSDIRDNDSKTPAEYPQELDRALVRA